MSTIVVSQKWIMSICYYLAKWSAKQSYLFKKIIFSTKKECRKEISELDSIPKGRSFESFSQILR